MGNQTYTYYWNGSQLAAMTVKRNTTVIATMRFYYDAEGIPFYFDYNATKYFYITNLQGDVVGIANSNGIVGYYEYDAWGKVNMFLDTIIMIQINRNGIPEKPV